MDYENSFSGGPRSHLERLSGTRCRPLWTRAAWCAALLIVALSISGTSWSAQTAVDEASATTEALIHQALTILKNPTISLAEKRQQLRALADSHFDFAGMARSSLGYRWKELTPQQRAEFVPSFTAFIEDAYLNKIQDYSGQDIEFIRARPIDPIHVEVYSRVIKGGAEPIPLDFMVTPVGGVWKIYDLEVDGISIMANYRTQFARVLSVQGFNQLLNDLKQKQVELASLLGKR